MSGITEGVAAVVGAVEGAASTAAPATPAAAASSDVETRLQALEGFMAQWGPILEALAPLADKL